MKIPVKIPVKLPKKQVVGENLLYVVAWSALILVPILSSLMLAERHVNLDEALIMWRQILPFLMIFFVHNWFIAPKCLLTGRYACYLISNVILTTVVFAAIYFYQQDYAWLFGSLTNYEFYWNVIFALMMNGTNGGIKLLYKSLLDEQHMFELQEENLKTEMASLKYQINPHFFMNTLNNIHALIDIDTEAAKTAVIDLSKMMRYVLYDSEREAISLTADLRFLKNYIELMRIRYTNEVKITIHQPQELPERVAIPPLLLIVFVENAFKHGVSYTRPSFIDILIECNDAEFSATISNSRHPQTTTTKPGGIGLENVRKRLDLIYGPTGYTLEIHKEEKRYTVKLIIPTLYA